MICPYCSQEAKLVTGQIIYPHRPDLYHKKFFQCAPCDAYVGCHENRMEGIKPFGRLANAELRKWKMKAHDAFDPLWKNKIIGRSAAYTWLANKLCIGIDDTHIGMFDIDMCKKVIDVCESNRLYFLIKELK